METPLSSTKYAVLWVLAIAQFTLSADVANLSISTSTLVAHFDTDLASIQLLNSTQPLVGATLMLSASMLGMFIGWRRLLIAGSVIGVASSFGFLLASDIQTLQYLVRPMAGLSSCMILPAVLALVVAHFPGTKRAFGFGIMAASTGLAAAVIPLLSGWIHDNLDWQWSFVFVGSGYFLTVIGSTCLIKPIETQRPPKFDIVGTILGTTSIMLLFLGLQKLSSWGSFYAHSSELIPQWLTFCLPYSPALLFVFAGAILLFIFIRQQNRFETAYGYALLPMSWMRNAACRQGFSVLSLMYIILGGSSFLIVTFLQLAMGLSSMHSGAIVLLFSSAMIITSVATPLLNKHISISSLCRIGFIGIGVAAMILIVSSNERSIVSGFYFGMLLLGAAIGVLASQCPLLITNALGGRDAEQSGGLQATVRNLSLVIGIALLGGVNQTALDSSLRSTITVESTPKVVKIIENETRIPYLSDNQLTTLLQHQELTTLEYEEALSINSTARVFSFHCSLLLLAALAICGLRTSSRIRQTSRE
ncbi:permease [Vibrio sp. qd031]|uniref:MFS transporter n=1 Tax=Vibrio sp. qd031 TaxID=1603038 RepID=UPI000A0FB56B|nr:MFS transporter [Vibrio sp. qd031]ORT52153.1 permease [Vibrio sp. qd031]